MEDKRLESINTNNAPLFLILGGYGAVGKLLARLLLQHTAINLVIAGRSLEKANEFATRLQTEFPHRKITSRYADAAQPHSLQVAFQNVQMVILTATTPEQVRQIGQAALSSGCDYLDILASSTTLNDLQEFSPVLLERKKTFITQGGFHPGLPAVFIRYGAQFFDRYDVANIALAMNVSQVRAEQTVEIVGMIAESETEVFKDGVWRKASYKDSLLVDMGANFGKKRLYPLRLEEIKAMPGKFHLKETGVYVSGFNWFVDSLVIPLIMVAYKIRKGLCQETLCRLFAWGVNTFSSPYPGVVLINLAQGMKDDQDLKVRISVEHEDGYVLTAIPAVACIQQYLDGILPPGLWLMGHVVDDKRLMKDMQDMGVNLQVQSSTV